MPAVSVMHNLSGNKKYEIARHHRNTIKWNPFGDLYIISGFGNLQGEIEIWSEAG